MKIFRDQIHLWLIKNATLLGAYRSFVWLILAPLIFIGLVHSYLLFVDYLRVPEVELIFSQPKSLVLRVHNPSEIVVRDPKYWVVLFNADAPKENRLDPLPIPVRTGDYIRPGDSWGPNAIFSIPSVAAKLKEGDRVIGWAHTTCPDGNTKSYWVYVQHGVAGWYAERKFDDPRTAATIINLLRTEENPVTEFNKLIDESRRVTLGVK